jgi:hypothetical protein
MSLVHLFRMVINFSIFPGASNHFSHYYRFGELDNCVEKLSGWTECVKLKAWSPGEVKVCCVSDIWFLRFLLILDIFGREISSKIHGANSSSSVWSSANDSSS